ncbi:MAG: GerAB/ArcD/ProY family transporter, partial [Clostridiales bacterium]|nr:GerAB/ArcD/ProY family transporter [Clostridiales bacterium]
FVVPCLSAWLFGESIVPGLMVFFVLACVYVGWIYGVSAWVRKMGGFALSSGCECRIWEGIEKDGQVDVLMKIPGPASVLLVFLQVMRLVVRLAFYICLTIEVLKEGQVPFMPNNAKENWASIWVVLPLLLVALYAANMGGVRRKKQAGDRYREQEKESGLPAVCRCGIEKQGRIYEMIFWLLFIPLVLVLLFGIREVDASIFIPRWNVSFATLLFRGYLLLPFLLPVENYILLRPFLQETGRTGKEHEERKRHCGSPSFFAVIGTVLLVCILTLFILGIYGVQGAGQEEMLTVAIMRYIRLPLGFIERVDVLLVWFFMIGCFVLIGQTLYFSAMLLELVFTRARRILLLAMLLAVALIIVAFLPGYDGTLWLYRSYGAVMDVPLSVILPVFGILVMRVYSETEKEKEGEA